MIKFLLQTIHIFKDLVTHFNSKVTVKLQSTLSGFSHSSERDGNIRIYIEISLQFGSG